MSGYEFVNENESNIDRYGIRIDKGGNEHPLFLGKVIYKGQAEAQLCIGRYEPGHHGICFIEVGKHQEIGVSDGVQILQIKS